MLVLLPYVLAGRLAPAGSDTTGFLVNPWDGFSYLAKMRQGAAGHWLFRLPYAPEPGRGAFLFAFYLALGHVAGAVGADLLQVFHAARMICSGLMFAAAFFFLRRAAAREASLRWSFALFAVGSGLGWLAGPLGLLTSDLLMPEAVPFYSALVNPHFPLTTALLAITGLLLLEDTARPFHLLSAAVVGSAIALVQPFVVLTMLAVGATWLAWEGIRAHRAGGPDGSGPLLPHGRRLLAFGIGSGPWLLYDLWAVRTQPALALWNAQNYTPSPPLAAYLLGFGLVGAAAAYGAVGTEARGRKAGRLLIAWAIVNFVLLYAPFPLQRRLALGLFLPLAGLAGMGLARLVRTTPWGKAAALLVVILSVPSNLLVTAAGLGQVATGDPLLLYEKGEQRAYEWLDENATSGALVLAAPMTGNRLPAHTQVRVLYGHPFETPHADQQRERVESLFASGSLSDLRRAGVEYVVYGPRERDLGRPAWLSDLLTTFRSGRVRVLEVPES